MRDKQRGQLQAAGVFEDEFSELLAQGHIELGKRLIEQQGLRLGQKRSHERDTGSLAAG